MKFFLAIVTVISPHNWENRPNGAFPPHNGHVLELSEPLYLKDNSPKSLSEKEASLLKKEQELLAAEQALLKKEQLLLNSSTGQTDPLRQPQGTRSETSESQSLKEETARARLGEDTKVGPTKSASALKQPIKESTPARLESKPVKSERPSATALASSVATVDIGRLAEVEEKLTSEKEKTKRLETELTALKKRLAEKEQQLSKESKSASQAVRDLNEAKARLMLAETQVERLSSIIEAQNDRSVSQPVAQPTRRIPPTSRLPVAPNVESSAEMPIATVIKKKVYLRTGPGKKNSPLMAVSKDTRLAVETMQGDWYRVITPTGARAWVSKDGIAFGAGGNISPVASDNAEDKAFELIRSR